MRKNYIQVENMTFLRLSNAEFMASMNDLTLKSQLKAETKPKKEIDRLRDRMLAYIIERIDFSRDALDAAVAAAAEKLYLVAKPCTGLGH